MAQSPSLGSVRQALIPGRGFQLSGLDAARTAPRPAGWRIPVARIRGAGKNREVIAFADHWKAVTGHDPALLIFDSKLTTQAVLAELDDRKIGFITLRARHPGATTALAWSIPPMMEGGTST